MNLESMLLTWWAEIPRLWGLQRSSVLSGGGGHITSFPHDKQSLDKPAPFIRRPPPGPLRPPLPRHSMSEMVRTQSYSTPRLSDLLNGSEAPPAAFRDSQRDRRLSPIQLKAAVGSTALLTSPLPQHVSPLQAPQDAESSAASVSSSVRSNLLQTPEAPLRGVSGDNDVAMADSEEPAAFDNLAKRNGFVEQDDLHPRSIRSDPRRTWNQPDVAPSTSSWDRRHHSLTTTTAKMVPLSRMRSESLADGFATRRDEWRDASPHQTTADAGVERMRLQNHPVAMHGAGGGRFAALLDVVGERMR